jgi:hypothetical protein
MTKINIGKKFKEDLEKQDLKKYNLEITEEGGKFYIGDMDKALIYQDFMTQQNYPMVELNLYWGYESDPIPEGEEESERICRERIYRNHGWID